jgi:hypothetical protein
MGVAPLRRPERFVLYVKAAVRGYLYGIFMLRDGSMPGTMNDLWFVGLTLLLAVLTWLGVKLCERLLRKP